MMRKKWLTVVTLITIVILTSMTSVSTIQAKEPECDCGCDCDPFLEVTFNKEISAGDPQEIQICLTDCTMAGYIIIVFNPGDYECLKEAGADFRSWVKDYFKSFTWTDWLQFSWDTFKADVKEWLEDFLTCNPDIAGKKDKLNKYTDPCDTWTYPDQFNTIIGNPNTNEIGEYRVVTVGIAICGCCCICVDGFCSTFFVIPEFAIGTIAPIITSLGSLSLLGFWTKRRKNN